MPESFAIKMLYELSEKRLFDELEYPRSNSKEYFAEYFSELSGFEDYYLKLNDYINTGTSRISNCPLTEQYIEKCIEMIEEE